MSLQDWVRDGWASRHKSSREEIQRLLALADRDLTSCATKGLATDWRFAIAYNALCSRPRRRSRRLVTEPATRRTIVA